MKAPNFFKTSFGLCRAATAPLVTTWYVSAQLLGKATGGTTCTACLYTAGPASLPLECMALLTCLQQIRHVLQVYCVCCPKHVVSVAVLDTAVLSDTGHRHMLLLLAACFKLTTPQCMVWQVGAYASAWPAQYVCMFRRSRNMHKMGLESAC